MVDVGDSAPDFSVPMAGGTTYNDIEEFTLSEALADGPVVLAFFPAAFTSGCTEEMCTFRDSMAGFDELDSQVYGVSVDLPFSQNVWIEQESLNFPMLSDWEHEVIRDYDVVYSDLYGSIEAAQRSIFVVDTDGTVAHRWVRGEQNPDFDELIADTQAAVAEIAE